MERNMRLPTSFDMFAKFYHVSTVLPSGVRPPICGDFISTKLATLVPMVFTISSFMQEHEVSTLKKEVRHE
jgi:hypothetical protein